MTSGTYSVEKTFVDNQNAIFVGHFAPRRYYREQANIIIIGQR